MDTTTLIAQSRTVHGKNNAKLRAQGIVPGVAYGHSAKPVTLQIEAKILEKVYAQVGGSKLVLLKIGESKARNVLIHDVQHDAQTGLIRHADFYIVRMDELLKAEIPLHFIGESTAVYQDEGTLVKNLEFIEVECLPADLVDSFEVDISGLDDFEKTITVADLAIPKSMKILIDEPENMLVAKIDPPRSDEEMAELDEAIDESGELPDGVKEEAPVVVSEENEGDRDRRDKK